MKPHSFNIKERIISEIGEGLKKIGFDQSVQIRLDHPQEIGHGDYTSNMAFILGKKLGENPRTLAEKIVEQFRESFNSSPDKNGELRILERVEVAGPGFINFWLSKDILLDNLIYIDTLKDSYGSSEKLKGKKIMVEFTDTNPFKEFHIGHLYSNTIGESLSRILESQGAIVKRACYQGDVGLHVAKALFGIRNQALVPSSGLRLRGSDSRSRGKSGIKELELKPLPERIKFLGKAYAAGSKAYEENEEAKKEIEELNKNIYTSVKSVQSDQDSSIQEIYAKGRLWSLEYFESIYKRVGTKFDYYYFESEVGKVGLELVKKYLGKFFEESDGAIIFPGEKYALHNRVFINSLGIPTYEAKELGLASIKYQDFAYDESIIVTGNEITEYFKVLLKALSFIYPDLASKTKHIGHGMVKLPIGKMSSRSGNVITAEWLLDETKRYIGNEFKGMDKMTKEKVTVGAVKYALLKSSIFGNDIEFDFHESINLHGNSGSYLQYTYVRTQSIIKKSEAKNLNIEAGIVDQLQKKEEIEISRHLVKFLDVVEESATHFSPHILCTYLFELSKKFNLFYQKHHVLESDSKDFRLLLTSGVGYVLKNGLNFLGIEAPQSM